MASPLSYILEETLYDAFRVRFDAEIANSADGVVISARPSSDLHDRVVMQGILRNNLRLVIEARPETMSRPLFDTMAAADIQHRMKCAKDLEKLETESHKFMIRAAGVDLCNTPVTEWPSSWDGFVYNLTIHPLKEHDSREGLMRECFAWIREAFVPLFDLLDITIEFDGYAEGAVQSTLSNSYERDPRNRKLCLMANGHRCRICGFDFEEVYGELGEGLIHVHHIVPVSKIGPGYIIDPVRDLIPVCPNCHAMLHRADPPLDPDYLRDHLRKCPWQDT